MYNFIQKFHSGWAYLVLLLLVIAVINSLIGKFSNKEFSSKDRKIALFGLIATHIQLVVAMVLYFTSPIGYKAIGQMADGDIRLTWLEHPLINCIAIVLITLGWSRHKKAIGDGAKFNSISLFYSIGLLLILSRIPWKLWLN